MCSVQEEEIEGVPCKLESKLSVETASKGRPCMKCSNNLAVAIVRSNDPLCKPCFLAYFTHKFRATIGKARVIRAGERVLLAFSGGPSSSAMLHLVTEGLGDKAAKKLRFEPGIAFIDEGKIYKQSSADQSEIIEQVREAALNARFPFYMLKLEHLFLPGELLTQEDAVWCKTREEADRNCALKLRNLFDSMSSMTAKEDLHRTLRFQQLLLTARKEGYSMVMLADCATRISVRLLSNIAQGRGGDLPYDTGFSDNRHGDVIFLRPMREFMSKEIALYNFFNAVKTVQVPTFGTMSPFHASIDRMTEEFVCGLQADFPFTVSTIFRTGDKLSFREPCEDIASCALCGVPLDTQSATISSMSEKLNNIAIAPKPNQTLQSVGGCCEGCDSGCFSLLAEQISKDSVAQALCYGCGLTFKDAKFTLSDLPPFVAEKVKRIHHRVQMKEQIKNFLLCDWNVCDCCSELGNPLFKCFFFFAWLCLMLPQLNQWLPIIKLLTSKPEARDIGHWEKPQRLQWQ